MKATLHVGLGKTGTTTIQHFLASNFPLLLKHKILYSMFLDDADRPILKSAGKEKLTHLNNLNLVKKKFDAFNRIISQHKIERFIWSLESLIFYQPEEIRHIKKFLDFDEIEIIIFLRRQDAWFQSAFYQWGWKHKTYQGKYLIGFEEFFGARKQNGYYDRVVGNWAEVFGAENIKIQVFEKEQMPNGLIQSFCDLIDLNIPELEKTEMVTYSNLGHYTSQVIGLCNAMHQENAIDTELISLLGKSLNVDENAEPFKKYALISPQQRMEIINTFEASNKQVATKYLNRADGILFYEPKPDLNEQWEPFEPMSLKHFIPIVFDVLLNQEKQIKCLQRQANQLLKNT